MVIKIKGGFSQQRLGDVEAVKGGVALDSPYIYMCPEMGNSFKRRNLVIRAPYKY